MYNSKYQNILDIVKVEKLDLSNSLVLTDPPYSYNLNGDGEGSDYFRDSIRKNKRLSNNLSDCSNSFDILEFLNIVGKIQGKENINILTFCNSNQIVEYLEAIKKYGNLKIEYLIWYKTNAVPLVNYTFKPEIEFILSIKGLKSRPIYNGNKKVFSFPTKSSAYNEYAKPSKLIRELIGIFELDTKFIEKYFKKNDKNYNWFNDELLYVGINNKLSKYYFNKPDMYKDYTNRLIELCFTEIKKIINIKFTDYDNFFKWFKYSGNKDKITDELRQFNIFIKKLQLYKPLKYIIDCFSGSGSVHRSAVENGYSAISFEVNRYNYLRGRLHTDLITTSEAKELYSILQKHDCRGAMYGMKQKCYWFINNLLKEV